MKPRERLLTAANHEEPDKIPVDFSGHLSSGISAIAYKKLKDYLGITSGDIYVHDIIQQIAIVEPPVLDRFQVDAVQLGRGFGKDPSYWRDWTLPDGTPCKVPAHINLGKEGDDWHIYSPDGKPIAVLRDGSLYFEQTRWPYSDKEDDDFSDLEEAMGEIVWAQAPGPPAPADFEDPEFERGAREFYESTDRAVVGIFGGNLNEFGQFFFRMDNFFMELAGNPDRMHKFLDRLVEFHLANLRKYLSAVGDYIDIIQFGDDLGTQQGPQMSRAMYDEFFKPRHEKLFKTAKELADVKTMLHCCGGVYELLPSLIDAGLDIINPVQTTARGMDPETLKQDFEGQIVLWGGGCDTQGVLGEATPGEIRDHVRQQIDILGPGGGFVFQQIHNIVANVPPENIVAMFDTVNEYRYGT